MLKKYLQTLLEAFLGSKKVWASYQSFPSAQIVTHTNTVTSGISEIFVAPSDGYICVFGNSKCVYINVSPSGIGTAVKAETGDLAVTIPARKGVAYQYIVSCQTPTDVSVRFIPSVGSV